MEEHGLKIVESKKGAHRLRGLMIQGTASDVGKSLLLTALCRLLAKDGYLVAPFKSQNMSNYTSRTKDGKEISKAQSLQAEAAKTEPLVWMNPIVLKPSTDLKAEVVMLGEPVESLSGRSYREKFYDKGIEVIKKSLTVLTNQFDIIMMEGAGSPVEMNLKDNELVNMRIAELADVPVLLVADIDRGGVFASIVGTISLLTEVERRRVKGIIINKFRGDLSLFSGGVEWIEEKVGIPVLGVVPFIEHQLESEDSLSEQQGNLQQTSDKEFEKLANQLRNYIDYEKIKEIICLGRDTY